MWQPYGSVRVMNRGEEVATMSIYERPTKSLMADWAKTHLSPGRPTVTRTTAQGNRRCWPRILRPQFARCEAFARDRKSEPPRHRESQFPRRAMGQVRTTHTLDRRRSRPRLYRPGRFR